MPYARRSVSTSRGRSTAPYRRLGKKRSNVMSRMRYGKQGARAQKKNILRNARLVNTLYKQYTNSKVYCDWKIDLYQAGTPTTWNWSITPLTNVPLWQSVLRANATVPTMNHTFVRNMQLTCNLNIGDSAAGLFANIFLVRPRYPSANRDFVTTPFQQNIDWIENSQNQGEMVHINPSVFKIIAKKQFRVMTNNPAYPQYYGGAVAGDLSRSTHRWEWNMKINMKVVSPDISTWKTTPFREMPYYNKLFLVCYITSADGTADIPTRFNATARFTSINVE